MGTTQPMLSSKAAFVCRGLSASSRLHEGLNVFHVTTLSRALSHGEANGKRIWSRPDKRPIPTVFSSFIFTLMTSASPANTSVVLILNSCDITGVSTMSAGHVWNVLSRVKKLPSPTVTRIEGKRVGMKMSC